MDMYDLVQRKQIKSTQAAAGFAADETVRQARRADQQIHDLEMRLERLLTLNEALWQLVCETTGLTDAHLAHRVHELDVADGERDGRKKVRGSKCSCGAMVVASLDNCQYCGAAAPDRSPWEKV